ncbi:MAG: zf-TFIIB domain-containing protein [Fimbriimonadales bacterium]|nr:zf-TFIIB domain-containing protein [Fimbriimonadales bacterium]
MRNPACQMELKIVKRAGIERNCCAHHRGVWLV